jgi:hypothetical protein
MFSPSTCPFTARPLWLTSGNGYPGDTGQIRTLATCSPVGLEHTIYPLGPQPPLTNHEPLDCGLELVGFQREMWWPSEHTWALQEENGLAANTGEESPKQGWKIKLGSEWRDKGWWCSLGVENRPSHIPAHAGWLTALSLRYLGIQGTPFTIIQ